MINKSKFERKWMNVGKRISGRILSLPETMQEILLSDVETAIENRLKVMERIQGA